MRISGTQGLPKTRGRGRRARGLRRGSGAPGGRGLVGWGHAIRCLEVTNRKGSVVFPSS